MACFFSSQTRILPHVPNTIRQGGSTKIYLGQIIDLGGNSAMTVEAPEATRHKLLAFIEQYWQKSNLHPQIFHILSKNHIQNFWECLGFQLGHRVGLTLGQLYLIASSSAETSRRIRLLQRSLPDADD